MRLFVLASLIAIAGAGAFAAASAQESVADAAALAQARAEAAQATQRYQQLDEQARRAVNEADRARAAAEALAARIEAAEADLTAAERRIALIAALQAEQRARLAERQGPVIRLTAALQTMTRRPAALALVQPGSVRDAVHVRSLLAATMPEIRRRTASLRAEVSRSAELRRQSEAARSGLLASRVALGERRAALSAFETAQRTRSQELAGLALSQSDRALVFGEEARGLAGRIGTRQAEAAIAASLARLPGPLPRPEGAAPAAAAPADAIPYSLAVEGRLVAGVGEISDGGVHSRGLTIETAAEARVIAPAAGQVIYAAPFRGYGYVVIIDHGRGWTSVITDIATLEVAQGTVVRRGEGIGRTGGGSPRVTLELRRNGRPVPFAQLIGG
ncbi:MAG: murein hydrolase activator [Sphingomonadales bacterium]|jgi:septal ring factor EnvC (AmiA/AmiB activator)|nr:murein hydrolase activator [Sphingomonadales bacterium]